MRWPFSRKHSPTLSPEVQAVFQKIDRLLNDEHEQNLRYPAPLQTRILNNPPVDVIPHSSGAFGFASTNPIPVNGILGELFYLSCLYSDMAEGVVFHRLGSVDEIDMFEILSVGSGRWDILFMNMYYPRKSVLAPKGFTLKKREQSQIRFLRGTNERLSEFPRNLHSAVRDASNDLFGMPIFVDPKLEDIERAGHLARPAEHQRKIDKIELFFSHVYEQQPIQVQTERVRFQWSTMTDTQNRGDIYVAFEKLSNSSITVRCEQLPDFVAHYASIEEARKRSPYDLSEHLGKIVGGYCMIATPDGYGE